MSNFTRTTFYIGVTSDLYKRVQEHRSGVRGSFTLRYKCFDLVYYEEHPRIMDAISREKELKRFHRYRKIRLINSVNPEMKDLFDEL